MPRQNQVHTTRYISPLVRSKGSIPCTLCLLRLPVMNANRTKEQKHASWFSSSHTETPALQVCHQPISQSIPSSNSIGPSTPPTRHRQLRGRGTRGGSSPLRELSSPVPPHQGTTEPLHRFGNTSVSTPTTLKQTKKVSRVNTAPHGVETPARPADC